MVKCVECGIYNQITMMVAYGPSMHREYLCRECDEAPYYG